MKKMVILLLVHCCCLPVLFSQHVPAALQQKIQGKKNLASIMKEVEEFYTEEQREQEAQRNTPGHEEEFESDLLQWKRWEYFNKTRLKPNGDLEDIAAKTLTAWEKVNAKYGPASRVASGSNAVWNFVGPFNMIYQSGFYRGLSKLDKIVFHPTDPNIFYVGANNGGLWRTLNGGASWAPMNFYFPIQSASGVAINPSNPNNIFILTGDGKGGGGLAQNSCGIWLTTDGGGNWIKTNFNSDPQSRAFAGYKIAVMPILNYIVFAATRSGLYRSTDSGMNWTLVLAGPLLTDGSNPIYDVEFDPSQPGRVYASGFGSFYLSEDFGATFPGSKRTNIPGANRIEIGVSPANSNYVYLLCGPYGGGTGTNTFGGVYRSATGGTVSSFTLRANTPNILCQGSNGIVAANDGDQSGYDLAIDVNKVNAEIITVGGKIIWVSNNGGANYLNLTPFNEGAIVGVPPANYIHPDIQDIAYNPLNNNLYACTDGGVYVSTNGGTVWSNITNGIHATTFYHMAAAPFDINRILGGTQDNGVKYKSNVGDFTHIDGADGFDCAFGPSASSSIYATINNGVSKYDINGISQAINTPANTSFFPVIAADPVTNNIVYLAAGAAGVLKTTNGGSTWALVLNQNLQQSICTCPTNSNRVYVASTNAIYRTDNGGANWTGNLASNAGFINTGQITDINVCSGNSDFVYVTMGGYTAGRKIFYSNNAGGNWFSISGTLPAEVKVNCVAIDQSNNAYIGTDMGVYYQSAVNLDWTPFFNELPKVPVTDLVINQASSRIRASTYGHGIWETSLFTTCDVNFTLNGTIAGDKFYQASNIVTTNVQIVGGNNTKITARAGNEIILYDGFTVYESNVFNGILGPCESGPVPPVAGRAADIPATFISQADRGSDTSLYSYGTITVAPAAQGNTSVTLHTFQPGEFSIIVTDKNGYEELIRLTETAAAGETRQRLLSTSGFTRGKYYVQLYHHGKLVHVQELDRL